MFQNDEGRFLIITNYKLLYTDETTRICFKEQSCSVKLFAHAKFGYNFEMM